MPGNAFVLSVVAPLAAAALRLAFPAEAHASAELVWVLAFVPLFLCTRHLAWRGALYGLGWSALVVLLTAGALAVRDGHALDAARAGGVILVLAGCALGAGIQADWWRRSAADRAGLVLEPGAGGVEPEWIPDRTALEYILSRQVALARRGAALTVALVEVEELHERAALAGPDAAAQAIQGLVTWLVRQSRAMDVVGLYDPETVLVVLPRTDLRGGHRFAQRLLEDVGSLPAPWDGRIPLDIGLAGHDDAVEEPADLLARCRRALEAARGLKGSAAVLYHGNPAVELVDSGMVILEPDGRLREIRRTV
ncbi:MAG: diguanylate cyclase [Gemmatimonadota bacterium]|nr:diguanylate cyclase [Gemmatimonadota bacterium]